MSKLRNEKLALRAAFELFDSDNSGTISISELEQLALCLGKRMSKVDILRFVEHNGPAIKGSAAQDVESQFFGEDTISKPDNAAHGSGFTLPQFERLVGLLKDAEVTDRDDERTKSMIPIFDHDAPWRITWDIVLIVLLLYVCLLTPYRIGLFVEATGALHAFELWIDVMFVLDMMVQFRTSYIDDEGKRVVNTTTIMARYFRGYFFIDLVSCLPWDLFVPEGSEAAGSSAKLFKTLRLMKLTKLGRVTRLKKFFETFKEFLDTDRETINIFIALIILCFATHMIACSWAFAGRYGSTPDDFCMGSWQGSTGYCEDTDGRMGEYTTALYWGITCLTTVGFGDISPTNGLEKAIASAAMVIGGSYYGYLIAVLTAYIVSEDNHQEMVNNNMKALISYMKRYSYPRPLRRKISAYFLHFYDNISHFDDMQMLRQLPYKLHTETARFLVDQIFRDYAVFARLSDRTITMFLQVLEPWSTKGGDMIAEIGNPAQSMYLLHKGIVNVTDASGKTCGQFYSGQSFMEYGILNLESGKTKAAHIYNAVTIVQCEVYVIDAEDLKKAVSSDKDMDQLMSNIRALMQFRKIAGFSLLSPPPEPSASQEGRKKWLSLTSPKPEKKPPTSSAPSKVPATKRRLQAESGSRNPVTKRRLAASESKREPIDKHDDLGSASVQKILEAIQKLQTSFEGMEGAMASLGTRMTALEHRHTHMPDRPIPR